MKRLNSSFHSKKQLTLECFGLEQKQKTKIKQIHNDYTVKDYPANNTSPYQNGFHDRYILVDGKVEIILTSGIDYLMNNKNDFTYIIRKLK